MPELTWTGKKSVVTHHRDVPYRLLKREAGLSVGDAESGNLLIQGDNLHALKALLPYYAGQVKCIYIDPPYNTGNEGWVYNDNSAAPEIKRWREKVVGGEGEDLTRHDKWLCMMYPRLTLLDKLLAADGVIFVSIDDNEVHHLRMVMDEVFGAKHHIGTFIWKARQQKDNRNVTGASIDHEYVLCYGSKLRGVSRDLSQYANPDGDPRGAWQSSNMVGLATREQRPNLHYDLLNSKTGIIYGCPEKGWRYERSTMERLNAEEKIIWPPSPKGRPRRKFFASELSAEYTGFSSIVGDGCFTRHGSVLVREMLGHDRFSFPKPVHLVELLIEQVAGKGDIVLDSFAGSGTTGHAVMKLNAIDGGNRQYILVEIEKNIAETITAERLKRAINGYGETAGLGGSFSYCTLTDPMFDEEGARMGEHVRFADLARHVFFSETGKPLPVAVPRTPLIGVHEGTAYYLLFNGILGDKTAAGGNTLTGKILAGLPAHEGRKVILGERNMMSREKLAGLGITFRQIPYEIKGR